MDGSQNKDEIALEPEGYRLCKKNDAVRLALSLFGKLRE